MQTLAQNGYSKQEILDALQFKSGSREIKFRYEQLDYLNNKIKDMTNILDCTISLAYLDDVKRTASFSILDDGSINYASDRIKPWARLVMPSDTRTYVQVAAQYNGIQTGEFNLNESTGATATNIGLGGSAMNGIIGANVTIGQAGIVEGSAFGFPGASGSANRLAITNGKYLIYNPTSLNGFSIGNEWSHTMFLNIAPNTAAGRIWQTQNGTGWLEMNGDIISYVGSTTFNQGVTISCRNPYGSDLRMIGLSRKVGNSGMQIYLNGVNQPLTSNDADPGHPLQATGPELWIGGDVNVVMTADMPTFYNVALNDAQMLELYKAGMQTANFGRLNYVEWPQGVFLLSAPSRDEDVNRVLTRKVTGFDGEQQYIDDVVTSRYTALAGTLYTNNILGLIMNNVPPNLAIQDPTYWNALNGDVTYPPNGASATIAGPTSIGGSAFYLSKHIFTIANADFRVNFTPPATGLGGRLTMMNITADGNNGVNFFLNNTTLTANLNVNGVGSVPVSIAYNAISMAYLRIWENNSVIFFQTSPDNVNWTTQGQSASWSYLLSTQFGPGLGNIAGSVESAWSVLFNMITLSASVLPTNINLTATSAFVPVAKDYDPGTTKLAIINDLLSTINYNSLYYDENGNTQLTPYVNPSTRPPEYVYADDDASVTLPVKSETFDLYGVPNKWVLVASNPDSTLYTATYTNSNPLSPSSTVSRGRTIVHYELESSQTDLATLTAAVNKMAIEASQVYDEIDFTTAIMPFHSTNDVYGIVYSDLGVADKYSEIKWSFQCKDGATMTHSARRQVQV